MKYELDLKITGYYQCTIEADSIEKATELATQKAFCEKVKDLRQKSILTTVIGSEEE